MLKQLLYSFIAKERLDLWKNSLPTLQRWLCHNTCRNNMITYSLKSNNPTPSQLWEIANTSIKICLDLKHSKCLLHRGVSPCIPAPRQPSNTAQWFPVIVQGSQPLHPQSTLGHRWNLSAGCLFWLTIPQTDHLLLLGRNEKFHGKRIWADKYPVHIPTQYSFDILSLVS